MLGGAERILVRGLNWIGDAVMSLPTLACLHDAVPAARITVLAPAWCADIYRSCPAVDDVLETPRRSGRFGFNSELALIRTLRRHSFNAAILLPNSMHAAIAPFAAGIQTRIGYRTDGRAFLLTEAVTPLSGLPLHTVLYYRTLLEAVGIPWSSDAERFDLIIPPEIGAQTETILAGRGAIPGRRRIGFSPGAAWGPVKRWPADHFARAAYLLTNEHDDRQALIFGSPADTSLTAAIVAQGGGIDLAGAFPTLAHLAAALASCDLLVTNDSGPMHLAAAVGTPVVALFGPTDERVSGPWPPGGRNRIIRAPDCHPCYNPACNTANPCLARIAPEEVVSAAEELLQKGGEHR